MFIQSVKKKLSRTTFFGHGSFLLRSNLEAGGRRFALVDINEW